MKVALDTLLHSAFEPYLLNLVKEVAIISTHQVKEVATQKRMALGGRETPTLATKSVSYLGKKKTCSAWQEASMPMPIKLD